MIRFAPARRIAALLQALVLLGLPFLQIRGESALRFDVPSLRLHAFGTSIWMDEFFIVLLATLFFIFLIGFLTLVFGRVWCGWACPQTVLSDLTPGLETNTLRQPGRWLWNVFWTFLVSTVVAASLIWYFVSPYEFFERLVSGRLGPILWGFWITLTVILFADLAFLRRRFCATICPYAKMQSVLYDDRTLVIAFDPARARECMDCRACVRACPVNIDVRQGLNPACINCASCIDVCRDRTEGRGIPPLIGYFFGLPGSSGRILRPVAILIGLVTAAFLAAFLHALFTRIPFEVHAVRNPGAPSAVDRSVLTNTYHLTIRNLDRKPVTASFTVSRGKVTAPEIELAAEASRKLTLVVEREISDVPKEGDTIRLMIKLEQSNQTIETPLRFIPFRERRP